MATKYTLTKPDMNPVHTDREDVRIQHEADGYRCRENTQKPAAKKTAGRKPAAKKAAAKKTTETAPDATPVEDAGPTGVTDTSTS